MLFANVDLLFVSTMFSIAPLAWTDECCLMLALAIFFSCLGLNHPEYQLSTIARTVRCHGTESQTQFKLGDTSLARRNNQVLAGT